MNVIMTALSELVENADSVTLPYRGKTYKMSSLDAPPQVLSLARQHAIATLRGIELTGEKKKPEAPKTGSSTSGK